MSVFLLFAVLMAPVFSPVYESDPILDLEVSADYRYLALCYGSGELGVLDLETPGNLIILARDVSPGGFGWAPGSNDLAFVERRPGGTTRILLAGARDKFVPEVLISALDSISEMGWIGPGEIVYLTDRDSNDMNLWKLDTGSGEQDLVFDLDSDIVRLWTSPAHGEAVLGLWTARGPELRRLSNPGEPLIGRSDDPPSAAFLGSVAFVPGSRHFVYSAGGESKANLFVFDLDAGAVTDLARLAAEPTHLAISSEGLVVASTAERLYAWRPVAIGESAEVFADSLSLIPEDAGYAWGQPIYLGERGWGRVAETSLVLQSAALDGLGSGRTFSRDIRDILNLAIRWNEAGQQKRAEAVLRELWKRERDRPARAFSVALARAEVSRPILFTNPRARWIDRALALTSDAAPEMGLEIGPETASDDAPETYLVWEERVLIAFCDRASERETKKILERVPLDMAGDPLLEWIGSFLSEGSRRERRAWQKIGRDLRAGRWASSAARVAAVVTKFSESVRTAEGLRLIAQGRFEPLAVEGGDDAPRYELLYAEQAFQAAMLELIARPPVQGASADGLKGRLLAVWARGGQFEAARELVHADLLAPEGSALDYRDMILRYLDAEEQDRWMEEAVEDILLSSKVRDLLARDWSRVGGSSSVLVTLAEVKQALIEGEMESVRDSLISLGQGRAVDPETASDPWRGRSEFLQRLFWAKYNERSLDWAGARSAYRSASSVIDDYPGDWNIAAFDLAWSREMIDAGVDNPDILKPLVQVIRGIGDPLVNPSHSPPTLRAALTSLDAIAFQCGTADPLYPFIQFVRALCYAGLDNSYVAIDYLRHLDPERLPAGLRNRVLFEEAALRSSLGQNALAARLLADLCREDLTPPELTVAIRTRAEAEAEAGMLRNQENRLRYLIHEHRLPTRWARTLIPAQTILPIDAGADFGADSDSEIAEGESIPETGTEAN